MDLNLVLLIITLLCIAIATFITTDKLRDRRFKWFNYKSYTPKGKFLIILNIIVFTGSVWQYSLNEKQIRVKEQLQDKKDSINAKNINDNTRNNFLEVIESLGKYSLTLDSTNKRLVKLIQDSAKTKIIEPDAPVLVIEYNGISIQNTTDSSYIFRLSFISCDASSTGFDCSLYMFIKDTTGYVQFSDSTHLFDDKMVLNKDGYFNTYANVKKLEKPIDLIYFIVQGTYWNFDRTKEYKLNSIYFYNYKRQNCGNVTGNTKKQLLKITDELKAGSRI